MNRVFSLLSSCTGVSSTQAQSRDDATVASKGGDRVVDELRRRGGSGVHPLSQQAQPGRPCSLPGRRLGSQSSVWGAELSKTTGGRPPSCGLGPAVRFFSHQRPRRALGSPWYTRCDSKCDSSAHKSFVPTMVRAVDTGSQGPGGVV